MTKGQPRLVVVVQALLAVACVLGALACLVTGLALLPQSILFSFMCNGVSCGKTTGVSLEKVYGATGWGVSMTDHRFHNLGVARRLAGVELAFSIIPLVLMCILASVRLETRHRLWLAVVAAVTLAVAIASAGAVLTLARQVAVAVAETLTATTPGITWTVVPCPATQKDGRVGWINGFALQVFALLLNSSGVIVATVFACWFKLHLVYSSRPPGSS